MKLTIGRKTGVAAGLVLSFALATGMAFAQRPGRGAGPGAGAGAGMGARMGGGRGLLGPMMASALGLTDAQKDQIKAIMKSTHEANTALLEQIKQTREQERAAVKAGKSEAELQSLAQSAAPLISQMHASHLVAQAKVYKVLTPEQREKIESLRGEMKQRTQNRVNRFRRGQIN